MIIKEADNTVVTSMEGTNFSFVENMDFLTDAIINLYSDPKGSIVRELVSNAYDATVDFDENQEKRAVIVVTERNISVQDFGGGMSPEFMKTQYTKIGLSTKRNNEKAIGAFGMGRLSVLSYTENYILVTVFEGQKYTYAIWRNNGINIDLISCEDPLEGEIGTRVEFGIKGDAAKWKNSIDVQLEYFDNVVVKYLHMDPYTIATNKIEDGQNIYITRPTNGSLNICFGKVAYSINWDEIGLSRIDLPFALYFPLNSGIKVPPSREALIYDESTKKIVVQRITEFLEWLKNFKHSYEDLHIVKKADTFFARYVEINLKNFSFNLELKYLGIQNWNEEGFDYNTIRNTNYFLTQVDNNNNKKYNFRSYQKILIGEFTSKRLVKEFLESKYGSFFFYQKTKFEKNVFYEKDLKNPVCENQFSIIQEYYLKDILTLDKALEGYEEFLQNRKAPAKEKKGLKYWRIPIHGDKICILDNLVEIDLKKIKKNYSQIFYNLPNDNVFTFLKGLSNNQKKPILILKLSAKELQEIQPYLDHKLFDLTMQNMHDNKILKKLFVAAQVVKSGVLNFGQQELLTLSYAFPRLAEDLIILKAYSSDTGNASEEWLDCIIEMGKSLKITTEVDVILQRVLDVKDGLLPLQNLSNYRQDYHNTLFKNYFSMFLKLKKREHFYPNIEENVVEIIGEEKIEKEHVVSEVSEVSEVPVEVEEYITINY